MDWKIIKYFLSLISKVFYEGAASSVLNSWQFVSGFYTCGAYVDFLESVEGIFAIFRALSPWIRAKPPQILMATHVISEISF